MMYQTHAITGWCTGMGVAAVAGYWHTQTLASATAFGLLGAGMAIVNDIDHHSSKITKILGPLGWILTRLIRGLSSVTYQATATEHDKRSDGKHRCLTHTGIWALALGGITWWLTAVYAPQYRWFALAVFIGCLTHDLGDAMTEAGVPLLWPLKIKGQRWYKVGMPRILRFKTGGRQKRNGKRSKGTEKLFIRPAFAVLAVLLVPGVAATLWALTWGYAHHSG